MRLLSLISLVLLCWGCQPAADKAPPLNIVYILADDMGPAQLGCYGSDYYETPHLDRLAAQGMRFTQAYSAAAICSPTRAAIMTGKSPAQLHLTDFIPGDAPEDKPLVTPEWQRFLPLEEETLGERFQALGYRTALFGKWHLSSHKRPPESAPYNPDQQGFDEYMVTYKPQDGVTDPEQDPHNVDSITQRGLRFLRAHHDQPFFLMLSHNSIHDPLMESEAAIAKYRQKPAPNDSSGHPVWGAMVERLDRSVGQVMATLDSLGLSESTLLVFYGDNGAKHAYAAQAPLRAGKGWLYEGGIRVPLLLRAPGRIAAGSLSEARVTSMDFTPTFLQALGQPAPDRIEEGISFWDVATGTEADSPRDTLYWHYPHYHRGSGMLPAGAIRAGDWKLIEWYETGEVELFDLAADPGEQQDLSLDRPEKAEALQAVLATWRQAVGAQMMERR